MDTEERAVIRFFELMIQLIEGNPAAINLSAREMDILLEVASHPDYEFHILSISPLIPLF